MHPPKWYRVLSLLAGELYDMPCNLVIISETEHLGRGLLWFLREGGITNFTELLLIIMNILHQGKRDSFGHLRGKGYCYT